MPENIIITEKDEGLRIDKWFRKQFTGAPYSLFAKLQRKKKIKVNGKRVNADYVLSNSDKIVIFNDMQEATGQLGRVEKKKIEVSDEQIADFKKLIIFENSDFLVINKPHGLASQGGSGISISVDDIIHAISDRYKLVHRLDKDTSGCLAIAKKTTAAAKFAEAMQAGKMQKKYMAVVLGAPPRKHGFIDFPLLKQGARTEKVEVDSSGKEAKSEYRTLRQINKGAYSLVELQPHTGRTHQLRVHMLAVGCPIMGDGKYGGQAVFADGFDKKMHLHAYSLECKALGIVAVATLPPHMEKFG